MLNKEDCLVRNGGKYGALGGIRTPDTWFRRPIAYVLSGHSASQVASFRICDKTSDWALLTPGTKASQPLHGQIMVKNVPTGSISAGHGVDPEDAGKGQLNKGRAA